MIKINKLSIIINAVAIVIIIFSNSRNFTLESSYYISTFFYGVYAISLIHSIFYLKIKDKLVVVFLDNLPLILFPVTLFLQDKLSDDIVVSGLNLIPDILFSYLIPVLVIVGISYVVSYFKFNPKKIMDDYQKYKFRIIFGITFLIIFFYYLFGNLIDVQRGYMFSDLLFPTAFNFIVLVIFLFIGYLFDIQKLKIATMLLFSAIGFIPFFMDVATVASISDLEPYSIPFFHCIFIT